MPKNATIGEIIDALKEFNYEEEKNLVETEGKLKSKDGQGDTSKKMTRAREILEDLENKVEKFKQNLGEITYKYNPERRYLFGKEKIETYYGIAIEEKYFVEDVEKLVKNLKENPFPVLQKMVVSIEKFIRDIKEGLDAENVGIRLEHEELKVGVGAGIGGIVLGAKFEGEDEIIKNLRKELEARKQEIKQLEESKQKELERKDKRIRELEKVLEVQQKKQQEDQKSLFVNAFDTVVEVASKNQVNSLSPSRSDASTPPPYNK